MDDTIPAPPEVRERATGPIRTDIPARLDRLPWSRWHWRVVLGLGVTWALEGVEATIVGSVAVQLQSDETLRLSASEVAASGTVYLVGTVLGALLFGRLTDILGRKRLFMVTLGLYTLATVLSAFSWGFGSFVVFRFLTGAGIGGEYAAMQSAIGEIIPARRRGQTDLSIASTLWLGAAVAAAASLFLLDPDIFPADVGWRICFGLGALLAVCIVWVRRTLPESPRWLMTRGRVEEAEAVVRKIEARVAAEYGELPPVAGAEVEIVQDRRSRLGDVARVLVRRYPKRTALTLVLMTTNGFLYNAIFFTYGLVLAEYFGVKGDKIGLYIFPFAAGNLLGPWLLGRLFDTVGRRALLTTTFTLSGVLLFVTGQLFVNGLLDATTITLCWSVTFFFASSAASGAHLTTSELWPMEIRATAIAIIYSVAQVVSGVSGPLYFAHLIGTGSKARLFEGYVVGSAAMVAGGLAALLWSVKAEGRALESIAQPLTATTTYEKTAGDREKP